MMKTLLKSFICGAMIASAAMFTSCSSEDEPLMPQSQDEALSRSGERHEAIYIDFENATTNMLAGPTSYGANLYSTYSGVKYNGYTYRISDKNYFRCNLNDLNGGRNFYNGGITISRWNVMSNPTDSVGYTIPIDSKTGKPTWPIPTDWWYSYYNQCSVYNTASTDGANVKAGAGGSNNFAVVYGYQDEYNEAWIAKPYFTLDQPMNVSSIAICNTAYSYGVMKYGNTYGSQGETESLESSNGWFKIIATGYKQDGSTQTSEMYICNYDSSEGAIVPLKTTWQTWNLGFTDVIKVEFNFEGSDVSDYGLNTPAYICMDNILLN
ncbi:MAG: DUF4465 domain-containing protein [Muribaculum sp.]|nr:DUF4465 domain-containing protein [Muribaculum sp.]